MRLLRVWRRLRGDVVGIPGVIYSDEMDLHEAQRRHSSEQPIGGLRNVRLGTVPAALVQSATSQMSTPGPEEKPYTFWERIGLVPVHPSRVRARQFYLPITDFALYDYDEISPEEKELTAKWMARVMEFNGAIPAGILCATGCVVLPLPTPLRMPLLIAAGATGVAVEIARSYVAAATQRQDLDDFLLAKEIWYIKNVETYQLGLPRIPRGREAEYQSYVDGSNVESQQELPAHLSALLRY